MNHLTPLAVAVVSLARLCAQDVLHYKFDEHCGSEVTNFAAGSPIGNAAITTTLPGGVNAARVPGRFDQALTGSVFPTGGGTTYVNAGWGPNAPNGTFSFAMWLHNRPGNPTAIQFGYLFGASGSTSTSQFRLFTGTSGKLFLSGVPNNVTSVADLTAMLNAGWVHAACTVDGPNMTATWYINGIADPPVALTQAVAFNGTNFTLGANSMTGSNPSPLETDEFLFSWSVWSPAEVLLLATAPRAGDGDYAAGVMGQCGAGNITLGSAGGPPAVGNASYSLVVTTTTPSLFVVLGGIDRCTYGGSLPLPVAAGQFLPLLNGCFVVTDAPVAVSGSTLVAPVTLPLPIPLTAPLGAAIYTQAIGIEITTLTASMSLGFATSTGM